jgi:hypothetical protein
MADARLTFGVNALPPGDAAGPGFQIAIVSGPPEVSITPAARHSSSRIGIADIFTDLTAMLGIDALAHLGSLHAPAPWDKLFDGIVIEPALTVEWTGKPSASMQLTLYEDDSARQPGVTIGGKIGSFVSLQPEVTVEAFLIDYVEGQGIDLKARVLFHDPDKQIGPGDPPPGKTQIVSYPFPLAGQDAENRFRLVFLGLGHHFAPHCDPLAPDPLRDTMDKLEAAFTSNDPQTVITRLAHLYDPDAGWFLGVDLEVRGFRVRAVFADPDLYGLEVTCDSDKFAGLLVEILYQKLGADLGVFYGKLVLPTTARDIQLGACSATIPSVAAWIYTNGDFKIAVGWPMGPDAFSLQVDIFMGTGGFYLGKLRSGDNPSGRIEPQDDYDPILLFGLALQIGIGRSYSQGPVSAEAALCLQGTFQGLFAWLAAHPGAHGIARIPDYYWFAASVGVIGVVQGSVDLSVISATLCIQLTANAGTALETDCNSDVALAVEVTVDLSIHVLFFHIDIHFDTSLDLSFRLIDGHANTASSQGPSNPELAAFIPQAQWLAPRRTVRARSAGPSGERVALRFLLQPTVRYDDGQACAAAVASLVVDSPSSPDDHGTGFERIADALARRLLDHYGAGRSWRQVRTALGGGQAPAPGDFAASIVAAMHGLQFVIEGVTTALDGAAPPAVAMFPMFEALVLTTPDGQTWPFADQALTAPAYPDALRAYFATLTALTPGGTDAAARRAGAAPDQPPLARLLFENWYLALARQMAAVMDGQDDDALPGIARLIRLAGMMSRMTLHGARLPDPSKVHGPDDPVVESLIHPLYALDRQQFDVAGGAAIEASLALAAGAPPFNITFAGGATRAVAQLAAPPAALPPLPDPWRQGLTLNLMPPLHQAQLCMALGARTQVTGLPSQGACFVMPLPLEAGAAMRARPGAACVGALGTSARDDAGPDTAVAAAGGLLIALALRRVPLGRARDVVTTPGRAGPAPAWSRDVYELVGTDDDTRALIEQLLEAGTDAVRRLVPLFGNANALSCPPLDQATQPVLLFKSNLSTTSQPDSLAAPLLLRRSGGPRLAQGPRHAGLDDVEPFLRLLWECSVVHAQGFYLRYADADGDGLDPALFDDGTAKFWVWVDMGAPQAHPALLPAMNSLLIADDGDDASKSTHYLRLTQDGERLMRYQPAYPPGFVGIEATWEQSAVLRAHQRGPDRDDPAPFSADAVDVLYHLLSVAIDGAASSGAVDFDTTLWSTALSPIGQQGQAQTYRQVLPAWRHARGSDGQRLPSPYQAMGASARLALRLSDIYGNALPTGATAPAPLTYNDPLLAPSHWPGCALGFTIARTPDAVVLRVVVRFDPAGLLGHVARLADGDRAVAALAQLQQTWQTIGEQIVDANVGASLTSSLFGDDWPALGAPAVLLERLREIVAAIRRRVDGRQPDKHTFEIDVPIRPGDLGQRQTDIFALGMRLTLARSHVDPAVAARLPSVAEVTMEVPPDLPLAKSPDGTPPLQAFACGFESWFAGFDGADGQLKLALRPAGADDGETPHFWGVRFSASAGIHLQRGAGPAAGFTLRPFSTKLMYGSTDATRYDASLRPQPVTTNPVSVDVDALMQQYLLAIDGLLEAETAAGIARAAPAAFDLIMTAKADLAALLARRLVPVLAHQPAGDPGAATDQFEQSLLVRLSQAYTTAGVVQAPVTLAVAQAAGAGGGPAPRLYGGFELAPDISDIARAPADGNPFSVSAARLDLVSGPAQRRWLTFQVSVSDTRAQSGIALTSAWSISHVEHLFEPGEQVYGYLPAGWLNFVLPSPLRLPLGAIDVPVPLRSYPVVPVLRQQQTRQAGPAPALPDADPLTEAIEQALMWRYAMEVSYSDFAPQDDLWVSATFNHPLDWTPGASPSEPALTPQAEQLLRFQVACDSLRPLLPSLAAGKAADLATLCARLVDDVATVLKAPPLLARAAPAVDTLQWVLRRENEGLLVMIRSMPGQEPVWPMIDDRDRTGPPTPARIPPGPGDWLQASYAKSGGALDSIRFEAGPFDLLARQTVVGGCRVRRNADIAYGEVNPDLVYTTPDISFPNVIVPYVEVGRLPGVFGGAGRSLRSLLHAALAPLATAGTALGATRTVRLTSTYRYTMTASADGASRLKGETGALMHPGQVLTEATLDAIVDGYADAFAAWRRGSGLPVADPEMLLAIDLFIEVGPGSPSGSRIPLVSLNAIDLLIP